MRITSKAPLVLLALFIALSFSACGGGGDSAPVVPVPILTTGSATSSYTDNATLNGTVNPNGLATDYWFEYGTSSSLATFTSSPNQAAGSGTSAVAASANISGLTAGTTYYYRIAASNSAGTAKGTISSFDTPAENPGPTVVTGSATSNFVDNATLNGTINPDGFASEYWFEYGTSATLATFTSTPNQAAGSGTSAVAASAVITGLDNATTYYYRIAGSNSVGGTSKGTINSFVTPALDGGPTADAGPAQTVAMRGPNGDTVVTLDASGSTDPTGQTLTYAWVQTDAYGLPPVTITDGDTAAPTFTVPQFAYGPVKILQFEVTVTDEDGLSSTDNVSVSINWGWLDDFSTDTTGLYTQTGGGSLAYGAGVAQVTTGAGVYKSLSRTFNWAGGTSPGTNGAVFSVQVRPTQNFGSGGFEVTLGDTANVRYFISSTAGVVEKYFGGVVVASNTFAPTACTLNQTRTILIDFDADDTYVEVCGIGVSLPHEATPHTVPMSFFTVTVVNQNATLDNVLMEVHTP